MYKPIFSLEYFSGKLDAISDYKIPYQIVGNPKFIKDNLIKQQVLSLPNGSAVGYVFNNDIYDQLSDEMTIEAFFYYSEEQTRIPNMIFGNNSSLGGFCLYETGIGESFGGMVFSVCTCSANVSAKALKKECLYLREKWHHVIGVFQKGTVSLYHNGVLEGTSIGNGDVIGEIMHPSPPNQILFVGGNTKNSELDLNTDSNVRFGFLRIYNTAFSMEKVEKCYELSRVYEYEEAT